VEPEDKPQSHSAPPRIIRTIDLIAAALTAVAIIPLILALHPYLQEGRGRLHGRP
jgi:hypothetical protein